jgi:hypothetical protein
MDFFEELRSLSTKIAKQKDLIKTEEATKIAFVMPFINLLGYDTSDPVEVVPEFDADVRKKQLEKVDYAIFKEQQVIMLIECKKCGENLSVHTSQLSSYFVATPDVHIGILTDGVLYQFYADLERPNIMDETPFFEFNMLDIQQPLVNELKRFTKAAFDLDQILTAAKDLKYTKEIRHVIGQQLNSPTEEFVRFVLSALDYKGTKTKAVVQQFTEIVKRALNEFIKEQHPQPATTLEPSADPDNSPEQLTNDEDSKPKSKKILIFEGKRYELDTYKACWLKCCKIVSEKNSSKFERLSQDKLGKEREIYFSKNPNNSNRHTLREIGKTGMFVECNFSADEIKQKVKLLAARFGCKASIEE